MTRARDRRQRDILHNGVETDRRLLDRPRYSEGFRGTVALLPGAAGVSWPGCASGAIRREGGKVTVDLGRCLMCGRCQEAAPEAFAIESGWTRPARRRGDLVTVQGGDVPVASAQDAGALLLEKVGRVLGRSLAIREVDAGSCNGCEVEISALSNPVYDVERFGVRFVASPRHADVLLVTGVGATNLEDALRRTYDATPHPKVVVAVGACACSGGIFGETYASAGGVAGIVPVDVYVPGCPPRPEAVLYGILLAVDRVAPQKTS
ncbi:MAG: NADH-quinone oxidoreductase subunit NuoB [Nitrososphaerota archaeon]|jgi:Ni,Fe-hydrogenase III small subunit/ferredoxin|nr:NADH-quinone oxidoreductase subunit NuoB [Nitrososphaerota archaeon]MDG6967630.1 NADH-quinone oxidoreductase subunit NuoB [Nitrososphaerota archaeon]MDG6979341.1 NADH-quinone oxidoreductase subunit NuoB [Nitrososphaerota archaeon]